MYSVASCKLEAGGGVDDSGAGRRNNPISAWNFLLACAASPCTVDDRRRIRRLAESELDWPSLPALAQAHGLLPVVHERLLETSAVVPGAIRDHVREAVAQNARQALWLTQLLFDVSDLFRRHGIQAIPYKGPVLAQRLYGNVSARQYSDIDILVDATEVPRARALLEKAGFITDLQLSKREEQAYIAVGYEYTFHSLKNPNVLEVQWRVLPRYWAVDFETENFFQRLQHVDMGGKSMPTLGNEDLLLVLCAHAAKHAWSKLSWIRDVAELSQAPDLDWERVLREAERLGIQRIVCTPFRLPKELLHTPVPPAVQRMIDTDPAGKRMADQTCRNLQAGAEPDLESLAYFRCMTQLRERRLDRLRFWWRLATTPGAGEWSLLRLPDFLFPLYRSVRVARLGARLMRSW